MTGKVNNDKVLELIPQRAPMVMLDEFVGMEGAVSKTRFTVREDNIFLDDGVLSECGVIEHIAQSAAARVGHLCARRGLPVPIGYIGAVNDFVLRRAPRLGDCMSTETEVLQEVFGITLIRACVYVGGEEIASCKMKIFLDADEA